MYGWTGKILKINLTDRTVEVIKPEAELYSKYIGGRGLAGYFLRHYIVLPWDDEKMPLILMTGPLVGTISPTSGRMSVVSKSPLTGTIGDTSVGGKMATELKKAGWDGIIITGKSKFPVGISVSDEKISFHRADNFSGLSISQKTALIPNSSSWCATGPAAENNVRFANIVFDKHYFSGRNGLGLVMNEKKLAFITVTGSGKVSVFNKSEAESARTDILRLMNASPVLKGEMGMSNFGTGVLFDLMQQRRMMPSKNFKETFYEGKNLNAVYYKNKYATRNAGCSGCPVFCKKISKEGKAMPEFETMSHFSALIDNSNAEAVYEANLLCNDMGMDTISTASAISCWLESTQKRIHSKEELLSIIQNIVYGKEDGKIISQGSLAIAKHYGDSGKAMQVKNLELPAYDPRGSYGMSLAYATSTRGGCHLRAYPVAHEILRKPVATNRFSFSGKARIIKLNEDLNAMIDSLTACKFMFFAASLEEYAKMLQAITGMKSSGLELLQIGERICYNERIMNTLNGFSSKDDDLPERFFSEEGSSGDGILVAPIPRDEFLKAREDYYKIRGLDMNGMPVKEKATELGLEWNI